MNSKEEIDNLMFEKLFGTPKYFNQRPWDVAMTTRLRKEYEEYEQKVIQDVHNGIRDFADYIFIMKAILDGPVMYFD
jgi:hypothetical protein